VTPGRYEVQRKRTDNKDTSSRAGHEFHWVVLIAWLQDKSDYGPVTLLAIRIGATYNFGWIRTSWLTNCIVTPSGISVWTPTPFNPAVSGLATRK